MVLLVTATDAMNDGDTLGSRTIFEYDFTPTGTGGTAHSFKFKAGDDVIVVFVAVLRHSGSIE